MASIISSGSATSLAANTKSADRVSGQFQHVGKGKFTLVGLASVTGMNCEMRIGGTTIIADEAIPFTGTAGTIDTSAHVLASQVLPGGRVELFFRNTTGGAITTDHLLLFDPL